VQPVEIWEMIRMIATARIVMPTAMVRLSAGRIKFTQPEQVNKPAPSMHPASFHCFRIC
jgi:biotin synthase-like enzyme